MALAPPSGFLSFNFFVFLQAATDIRVWGGTWTGCQIEEMDDPVWMTQPTPKSLCFLE